MPEPQTNAPGEPSRSQTRVFTTALVVSITVLLCACASRTAQKQTPLPVDSPNKVLQVSGYCSISTNEGRVAKFLRPVPIPDGAILESVSGDLDLQLHSNQILVHLAHGSKLKIERAVAVDGNTETILDLQQGHLFVLAQQMSTASIFMIKSPTAVLGIRSQAAFEVHADGLVRCQTGAIVTGYMTTGVLDGSPILNANTWSAPPKADGKFAQFGTNDVIATERLKREISELRRLLPPPPESLIRPNARDVAVIKAFLSNVRTNEQFHTSRRDPQQRTNLALRHMSPREYPDEPPLDPHRNRISYAGIDWGRNAHIIDDIQDSQPSYSFYFEYPNSRGWVQPWLPKYSSEGKNAELDAWIGPSAHGAKVNARLEFKDGSWTVVWIKFSYYV